MKIYYLILSLFIIECSNPKKTESVEVLSPPLPKTVTTSNVKKLLRAIMGTGIASGDDRAINAAQKALDSPSQQP